MSNRHSVFQMTLKHWNSAQHIIFWREEHDLRSTIVINLENWCLWGKTTPDVHWQQDALVTADELINWLNIFPSVGRFAWIIYNVT